MNTRGARISVSRLDDWLGFDEAAAGFESGKYDGVGLLMSSYAQINGGLVGLDLDRCLEADGTIAVKAVDVVADFLALGGYIEVSPSGRGLRQFLKGVRLDDFKEKCKVHGLFDLEVYDPDSDRYLTVTGQPYPVGSEAGAVVANQTALEAFISRWCERVPEAAAMQFDESQAAGVKRSSDEVLKLLKTYNKRGKISRLLAGDTADYGGNSEADAALCFEAAYFSRDPVAIDAIIRGSGLMREKWDSKRGRETYGSVTIRNALKTQTRNFDADQTAKAAQGEAAKVERIKTAAKGVENLVGGLDGLTTPKGAIKANLWARSELMLRDRRLLGCLYWDEFGQMPVLTRSLRDAFGDATAPATVGRVTDCHLLAVVVWLAREWEVALRPKEEVFIVTRWAQSVRRNPLAEKLLELEKIYDGKPRLNSWPIDYCRAKVITDDGADITPLVQAFGSRWVISAVARAMQPGCKADAMLVLEGKQGARKSSAVRAMAEALGSEYFREGYHLGAGAGKDEKIALRGKLIIEWAELSGLGKRDRNEIKTFLTLQTDSYRGVWGTTEADWPRTAIFCGTTNDSTYLSDPTGNRRFWPVTVGRIDLDGLRRDAAQIWAEAVVMWRQGQRWWLDDDGPRDMKLIRMAEAEQFRRVGGSVWDEVGSDLAERLVSDMLPMLEGAMIAPRSGNFSVEQMRHWLGGSVEGAAKIDDGAWIRAAEGLKRAGWESITVNGRRRWRLTDERRGELCQMLEIGAEPKKSLSLIAAERVAAQAMAVAKAQKGGQTLS
ncbi:MAG: VapE family protein [Azonexus sp.]|nr:VapE family protein [Azonexus sp.]